ncbi:DUF2497 domain-containing protein [Sphingobium sufflavum]|uniref:DUF2497 domain-containing protein n=1 Tax=Sphingobium sufflavum TaxID=1129547 RepID=UPI001F33F921|nr:DUF2497 domain-containing protein [Sphingobium sufflavum]MCE7795116.1 DUF2497 domain-containing protein [Sphingobium sufflavum]
MGVVANEPSMEDILSSIKRIIADGSDRASPVRPMRRRAPDRDESELSGGYGDSNMATGAERDAFGMLDDSDSAVLELTDKIEEPSAMTEAAATTRKATPKAAPQARTTAQPVHAADATIAPQDDMILSDLSTQAARESLNQLSSLLVRPQEGDANTLEGLVREMLRPMLKDWMEAHLPDLVQSMVKKEIDRIVGRLG